MALPPALFLHGLDRKKLLANNILWREKKYTHNKIHNLTKIINIIHSFFHVYFAFIFTTYYPDDGDDGNGVATKEDFISLK